MDCVLETQRYNQPLQYMKILIIEDHPKIRANIIEYLTLK